jgi:hypothetical protein
VWVCRCSEQGVSTNLWTRTGKLQPPSGKSMAEKKSAFETHLQPKNFEEAFNSTIRRQQTKCRNYCSATPASPAGPHTQRQGPCCPAARCMPSGKVHAQRQALPRQVASASIYAARHKPASGKYASGKEPGQAASKHNPVARNPAASPCMVTARCEPAASPCMAAARCEPAASMPSCAVPP